MTIDTTVKAPKQVAVNDIGTAEEFLAAVEKTLKFFNDGDLIEGTVVKIDRDEVLLDVGYKTEGVIPSRELSIRHDADPGDIVSVGDKIEALVLQKEDKEGRLILSKKRALYERAWGDVEKVKEADGTVTGTVIEVVKGGLIVDIGLRGFLPASLIELRRVRDLGPYLGQEVEAKILELDKNRNNVVLSRRALLEQSQSASRSTFLADLAKGQIRTGVVSSIVNFGAFIDLGGVDGLVHVSELSWKHIELAEQVVAVNQDVFVKVIDIDLDRRRISLSLKQALEEVNPEGTDFNPALYGMYAEYDDKGAYKYPDGFDAATGEWQPGHEEARAKWEKEYSEANARWEEHKKQVAVANKLAESLPDVPAPSSAPATDSHTSEATEAPSAGTLSEDASLSALRDKLSDNE